METNNNQTTSRFFTVSQWSKEHNWPSASGLRHLIFHADKNGFSNVIRRAGRRILISERDFFLWLDGCDDSKK